MIEKTEVAIKNEQSKGTGHIGNKTQVKQKNKTPKIKTMNNTDPTNKPGVNPGAHEGQIVHISYKTPAVVLKLKSGKSLVRDRGKINLRKRHKIHCYLRIGYFVTVTYFVM